MTIKEPLTVNEAGNPLGKDVNSTDVNSISAEDYFADPRKIALDERNQAILRSFTVFHHKIEDKSTIEDKYNHGFNNCGKV